MSIICTRRVYSGADIIITKRGSSRSKIEAKSKEGAMWLFNNIAEIRVEYEVASEHVHDLTDVMNADGLTVELK